MLTKYALIVLASFLVSALAVFLLKKYSLKHNLLISKGVPAVGGIALGWAFYLVCGIALIYPRGLSFQAVGILISSLAMLVVGMIDDKKELSVPAKFLTQLFCVLVLILFGVKMQIAGLGSVANLGLTVIWVLGITNAFNHLDVMDGVAASVAVIAAGGLGVICLLTAAWAIGSPTTAFWPADLNMLLLLLPLMGAVLGFLIFNLPPARVYLGNAGSHFLGFILASLALALSYAPLERRVALLSPVLVLGFPVFDTVFVVWMRILKRRSAFRKSADHLALRFLKREHSKPKALSYMLLLTLFFTLSGVALSRLANFQGVILIGVVVMAGLLVGVKMAKVDVDNEKN
ncbi:MAG: MraY family glycosyltransferase [Candidatus Omnitrophota bacterium]|nr:MraY family glycosyltransferase [Candidatus Omnitrophota bacterium]